EHADVRGAPRAHALAQCRRGSTFVPSARRRHPRKSRARLRGAVSPRGTRDHLGLRQQRGSHPDGFRARREGCAMSMRRKRLVLGTALLGALALSACGTRDARFEKPAASLDGSSAETKGLSGSVALFDKPLNRVLMLTSPAAHKLDVK